MTSRLSILAEVPLPLDRIDAYKIEVPFLELAEKFRTDCNALAKKLKVEGFEFGTKTIKTKDTSKSRKTAASTQSAAATAAPVPTKPAAPEPAPATPPAAGKTPPWAKSPLAAQLDAANAPDGDGQPTE